MGSMGPWAKPVRPYGRMGPKPAGGRKARRRRPAGQAKSDQENIEAGLPIYIYIYIYAHPPLMDHLFRQLYVLRNPFISYGNP